MTTKYDMKQTVLLEAQIEGISVDADGEISYQLWFKDADKRNCMSWVKEEQIYGSTEPSDKVSTDDV